MHVAKSSLNSRGGRAISGWVNGVEKLTEVAAVIRENFQITNWAYDQCIDKLDFDRAFFYADPPYLHNVRTGSRYYQHEFSEQDHRELAHRLNCIKGKAMVSGYFSEIYNDELYEGWRLVRFPIRNNHIRKKEAPEECIWMNYYLMGNSD